MKLDFGKHKGKTLEWIVENDYGYAEWLYNWLLLKGVKLPFGNKTNYEYYLCEIQQELEDEYKVGHPWKNPKYATWWAKF